MGILGEWLSALPEDGRVKRPLQLRALLCDATSLLDRSIGSGNGSRENSTQVRERSTCTRLEQMRWMEKLTNSAESSQPKA